MSASPPSALRTKADGDRLVHLQALRGVAATLVVLSHAIAAMGELGLFPADIEAPFDNLGYVGVSIFFVISGFIIFKTSRNLAENWSGAKNFIIKRAIRIYPIYWLSTLLVFLLSPHRSQYGLSEIVCSLLLIPHFNPVGGNLHPMLGQGWTLDYEILFYAIFFLTIPLGRRAGPPVALSLLIAIVAFGTTIMGISDTSEPTSVLAYWSRPIVLLFTFGVAIGFMQERGFAGNRIGWPLAWVLALLVLIMAVGTIGIPHKTLIRFPIVFVLWIPCVLCVAACVFGRGAEGRLEMWMHRFGDASYSTYLFHTFILSLLLRLKFYEHGVLGFILAAVVLSNLLGWALYVGLETRTIRFLRLRLLPRGG